MKIVTWDQGQFHELWSGDIWIILIQVVSYYHMTQQSKLSKQNLTHHQWSILRIIHKNLGGDELKRISLQCCSPERTWLQKLYLTRHTSLFKVQTLLVSAMIVCLSLSPTLLNSKVCTRKAIDLPFSQ